MEFADLSQALRPFWAVWLTALFLGICAWAFWPSRKRQQEVDEAASIPLKDDD